MEVLIADDEPAMRGMLARTVERLGYRALTAANGENLTEIFLRAAPPVVLCDINFGAEDGVELCLKLRKRRPQSSIVLMTGDDVSAVRAEKAGFKTILLKPFTRERLEETLRELSGM